MMGYWEERQEAMYKAGEMKVNQYFTGLEKAFNQTRRELQKTIEGFYFRYAEENGFSYSAAQRCLDAEELGELQDFIDLAMKNIGRYNQQVNNMSLRARITRYQALEAQVDAILRQLYAIDYEAEAEKTMQEVYEDTYYRTWYNADQYHGFHAEFAQINPGAVQTLLEYPFNGAAFSRRLWKQKDHLQAQLMEAVTTMLIQGKHPSTLTKDFAKKMNSKKFDAYRLLHTESSFLMSEAAHAGYVEDGVPKYEILATLDSKTCGVCGELDSKVYEVGKEVVGVNKPPFHPLCRCTTVPHYDDTPTEGLTRAARDADGNSIEVPADMTYSEWKKVVDEGGDFTSWKKPGKQGDSENQKRYAARREEWKRRRKPEASKAVSSKDPEKTEKPILNRDEIVEQAKLYGAELEKNISLLKYDNGYPISNYLNEKLGYDKKPSVVSSQEFEQFKEEGKTILYRGVTDYKEISAHDMVEQFKYGNFYCGRGIYGYGTYTDTNKAVANYYAYDSGITDNGKVMEMILTDDAKIVDYLEIFTEYEKTGIPKIVGEKPESYQDVLDNVGAYASIKGYDAISLNGFQNKNHVVILNRGKVIVKE